MRYASKQALLESIEHEHERLRSILEGIPLSRWDEPGVWGNGWTIHDLVAHLAEWHALFLGWYRDGKLGKIPHMPAAGYRWNETPRLNRDIQKKHRSRPLADVRADFAATYEEIRALAVDLSEDELLSPGHFAWTGKHPLATYMGPNTASHYRFAIRVLRRWLRAGT